ncbi:MAG: hypothetical protein JO353_04205, partial [Phycisphaerae bacterium]|nr:hypothetical protein [Phycisphaerae bacterium]
MPVQPAVLTYVDTITAGDATKAKSLALYPDVHRIIVPPIKRWRSIGIALPLAMLCSGGSAMLVAISVAQAHDNFGEMSFVLIFHSSLFAAFLCVALDRFYRGFVFEISPYALRITAGGLLPPKTMIIPRSALLDVHLNQFERGKMIIRLSWRDPLERYLGSNEAMNQKVVNDLIAALNQIPPALPRDQEQFQPDDSPLPASRFRTTLLWTSAALILLGIISMAVYPTLAIAF